MIILYIAGPMTGHDDYNRPAFHQAAAQLRGGLVEGGPVVVVVPGHGSCNV